MNNGFSVYSYYLVSCLLLVTGHVVAQEEEDDRNQLSLVSSSISSSPFDPPEDDSFVTDSGPGLDTGCTFKDDPGHPLTIDIMIDRAVGPVDANGFLVDPAPMIAQGIIPSTIDIQLPAFDIDVNGTPPPENDAIAFNGENLGVLTGDNNIWKLNTFSVPISKIKFPTPPAPGAAPVPRANRVVITIDTLSNQPRWCASVDWVALIIPIQPKIALTLKPDASGSNSIRENSGNGLIDTIYQQSADTDCNLTEDIGAVEDYPFSSSAQTGIGTSNQAKVKTIIEPCPVGSLPPSPDVIVKWAINGTSLSGTETWSGLEGDVTMSTPGSIGAYNVTFEYTVDEEVQPVITRKLFVTKKAPLGVTPRLSWYKHATSWAAGKSSETDILDSLLQGIYTYGGANWKYNGSSCSSEQLLADPLVCNSSDCYAFSNVLDNLADTLGVGGLTTIVEKGTNNVGFITNGNPSLDPLFTGNARPFALTGYDKYVFGNHSLRQYGATYYDATFNGIYTSSNEFIAWNFTGGPLGTDTNGDNFEVTDEGAKVYDLYPLNSYLNWNAWEYKNPSSPLVLEARNMAMTSSDIEIANTAIYSTLDVDNNGVYEAIIANVEITIMTPGYYLVRGVLKKNGAVISNQPVFETQLIPRITVGDQPGIYDVAIQFSGEDIYQSGENGPYTIDVVAYKATGTPARKELTTPGYDYTKFGEKSGRILTASDSVLDTDTDTRYDFLVVEVDADIVNAGTYMLQGTLLKDGHAVVNAADSYIVGNGTQTLKLQFPGVAIFRSDEDGPYEGVISLRNQAGERQGDIRFVTQAYDHTQFEGILDITGALSDQGVDTNANSLFDLLRIDLGVDVREAGTYQITAALGNLIDSNKVYSDVVMNLGAGAQTMTLNFSGSEINSQEMDGPYVLSLSLRDPSTNELKDSVDLTQQTAAYSHLDFEPLTSVNPIILTGNSTDDGIDNNSNGQYDLLQVSVELKLTNPDTYTWSARLVDADETEIGFDSRSQFLNVGTTNIDFFFDGNAIGENGVAGPYQVKGLLISGQSGANLVSSQVATTQAYGADEFEGFIAQQDGDIDGDGDVDRDDLNQLLALRNTPASGANDPLDLDGDGVITGLDARKLVLLCSRPRCATQ